MTYKILLYRYLNNLSVILNKCSLKINGLDTSMLFTKPRWLSNLSTFCEIDLNKPLLTSVGYINYRALNSKSWYIFSNQRLLPKKSLKSKGQFALISYQNIRYCSTLPKVYTKSGDKGTSSLYNGERKPKDNQFFVALGSIDELSSFIGLAKEFAIEKTHDYVEQLERIQCILQDIGTIIATPIPKELNLNDKEEIERINRIKKKMTFNERHIAELEGWIDQFTESLPPLTNFILPGGGRVSASLHVCRTVCRGAERAIIALPSDSVIDGNVKIYLNRLSDYLFTIARHATILDGKKETVYIRPKAQKDPNNKPA